MTSKGVEGTPDPSTVPASGLATRSPRDLVQGSSCFKWSFEASWGDHQGLEDQGSFVYFRYVYYF